MKNRNVPNRQRGFILLTVVVAITLVAAIALALSYQGASQTTNVAGELERDRLRYITEAGMAHARWQLSPSDTCDSYAAVPSTAFGGGTYAASVSPSDGSPVTVSVTGTLATGAQHRLSRNDVKVYSSTTTQVIKLQPGAEGQDTYIEVDAPDSNYGGQDILMTDGEVGGRGPIRSLLRFDLSGIPSSLNVSSAKLSLFMTDEANTPPVVEAHRVLKSWSEGTGGNDGATWNTTDGSTAWSNPGVDYDAAVEGSFVADSLGWKHLDVTSLARSWVNGSSPNYGLVLLSPPASGNNEITYHSSDVSEPTLRPKLTVTVACECGQLCAAADNTIYLSTDGSAELGGLIFLDKDLVEYDRSAEVATLFFDGIASGMDKKIDALHVLANGHLLLSTDADTTFGGLAFTKEDLIDYNPTTGTATMFLEADVHFDAKQNIVSVHMLDNGNLVLSTAGSATLGGVSFSDRDLVEYNPNTGQASIFFDGDATTLSKKIFAVFVRDNGNIILAPDGDTTLGGLDFGKDQLIDYDPASDTATLFFDGSVHFASTGEAITALHVGAGSGSTTPGSGTLDIPVASANDDAEERTSDGWMYLDSSDLELVDSTEPTDMVGIRFVNVGVPQGATISNAYVQFQVDETGSGGVSLTIEGEATDDAAQFTTATNDISARPRTSASAAWTPAAWNTVGERGADQRTVDISSVIQEIVDRPGWSSGNALAIIVSGTGTRTAESYDGDPVGAPELHIEFGGAGGGEGGGEGGGAPTVGYLDEFNSRDCAATDYAGSDGTLDWSSWSWIETGEADGSCSGLIQVVDDSAVPDPGSFRLMLDERNHSVRRQMDLSGFATATLSFDYRLYNYPTSSDSFIVLVSRDGAIWQKLDAFTGIVSMTDYQTATYDITAFIGSGTSIGFMTEGINTIQTAYIDNVRVVGTEGGGGGDVAYVEQFQTWAATSDGAWETFDLSTLGVPADAVVEVAITNSKTGNERWGGVRATGSTLDRRLRLHEPEDGGIDALVMHVQADASSRIEMYAEKSAEVAFTVLGYWTGAAYVERFDSFTAGGSNSWLAHDLGAYGVGANQVAEIALTNTDSSNEWLAGVRSSGSGLQRRVSIHEAESGGIDAATMMVNTDASATAEVYSASDGDIEFVVLGYWSTPPGTYTESGGVNGQVSTVTTWEAQDLSSFGVPADSVVQFMITSESPDAEGEVGVRSTGSSLARLINLQEAEPSGSDTVSLHANVDATASVEWYAQYAASLRFFYPIGWWVLN